MKVLTLVCLLALAVSSHAYSFLIPAKPGLPGQCRFNGMLLQRGDNELPSACQKMTCNEDGSILVQGCGHFDMRDCRVVDAVNLHKPYPDCCKMNFLCTMAGGQTVQREISPLDGRVYA